MRRTIFALSIIVGSLIATRTSDGVLRPVLAITLLVVSLKLIPAKLCSTETAGAVRSSKRSKYGRHRGGVRAAPRGLVLCPWRRPTRRWENSFMTDLLTRS